MKLFSVFHNGNEISLHNSIWGVESIRYNGRKMSSEFSFWGAFHQFMVHEGEEEVDYEVKVGFNCYGVSANIWRNGELIMEGLNSCSHKSRYSKHQSDFV